MPTYTYHCRQCHKQFEYFQSIVDPPLRECSFCNGELERVITGGSGLIFKGSGFYITDYRNQKKNSEKTDSGKETSDDKTKKEKKAKEHKD